MAPPSRARRARRPRSSAGRCRRASALLASISNFRATRPMGVPSAARARAQRVSAAPAWARNAVTFRVSPSNRGGRRTNGSSAPSPAITVTFPKRRRERTKASVMPLSRPLASHTTWPGAGRAKRPGSLSGSRDSLRLSGHGSGCSVAMRSAAALASSSPGAGSSPSAGAVATTTTGRSSRPARPTRSASRSWRCRQSAAAAQPLSTTR